MKIQVLFLFLLSLFSMEAQNKKREFRLPEIPSSYHTPQTRSDYLCIHYWDHYDFQDTLLAATQGEQIFVDFLSILPYTSDSIREQGLYSFMQKAAGCPRGEATFYELAQPYLLNADSPYQQESYFLPLADALLKSGSLDAAQQIRCATLRNQIERTRAGAKAPDFQFQLADGSSKKLSELSASYTLLFFFDPTCDSCLDLLHQLIAFSSFEAKEMQLPKNDASSIQVLTIYPDARSLSEWRAQQELCPGSWINGFELPSKGAVSDLYGLDQLPVLYLLDAQNRIILRNASLEKIRNFLQKKALL